jgi:hypothetical protein
VKESCKEGKAEFKSEKNEGSFQEHAVVLANEKLTFDQLVNQFMEDNPGWKKTLKSVPTALLVRYTKHVLYSVTEDDVRDWLKGEFKDVKKQKRDQIMSAEMKVTVDGFYKRFKDKKISLEEANELLNTKMLDIILVGENCSTEERTFRQKRRRKKRCFKSQRNFYGKMY